MLVQDGLTQDELQRYSRHLVLPEVGIAGQRKLKAAKVLLIGAGGLGSPLALYLAAAGVGTLGIIDSDVVEVSNLQRQIVHDAGALGVNKAENAAARLGALNGAIDVRTFNARLNAQNALRIMRDYDVVVDGSDNFPTRYLVNDACVMLGKPNVYGSVYRFEGQASVFDARVGPCYRCLFPQPPPPGAVPSCEEGGVLGVLPGIIGLIQATEAIKLIIGAGQSLCGRLLVFDALEMRFRELKLAKASDCPACGPGAVLKLEDIEASCAGTVHGRASGSQQSGDFDVTPQALKAKLQQQGSALELLDVREDYELQIAALPYTKHIPIGQLASRVGELDPRKETVVYCHSGARSGRAVRLLRNKGFNQAFNLEGGISRWTDDIEPGLKRY